MKLLPILVILGSCTLGWGAGEGFESYSVGQEIGNQGRWQGNATVTDEESVEGNQSLKISSGETASLKAEIPEGIVFWDFYMLPVFAQGEATLNIAGAKIGFRKNGSNGEVLAFSEDSPSVVPFEILLLPDSGQTESWVRFTIRVDPAKGIWDLYLDSKPIIASIKLGTGSGFEVKGQPDGCAYLDLVEERKSNPVFEDNDADGMPDAEEKALGLNPFVDDRDADLDGDGISNVAEMFGNVSQAAASRLPMAEVREFLFVDNLSGNDSWTGRCSYPNGDSGPMATIKAAMEQAESGDVICVLKGSGTYREGSRGVKGKALTIRFLDSIVIQ